MLNVYIVEDDANISEIINYALHTKGYHCSAFSSSGEFWKKLDENIPDLIILDLMLPEESGVEILSKIKSRELTSTIPVIILSAKSSEFDKVSLLELGADDYITKPFSVLEFLARVKVVTKRYISDIKLITHKNISVDLQKHCVYLDNKEVEVTRKEFDLLVLLLNNKNNVVERDVVVQKIWGYDFEGESRTVDVHINSLRKKLYKDLVKTIRGVGYIIND